MPKYRIIVSSPDDLDSFTIDTVVENAADEANALDQLRKSTQLSSESGEDIYTRPKQNLRVVRD